MNVAEWIIVGILAGTLLVFLIVGIILVIKLIDITKEARKIIITSQGIAQKADDVVDNVKDMTSIGGVVKTFLKKYRTSAKTTKSSPQSKSTSPKTKK